MDPLTAYSAPDPLDLIERSIEMHPLAVPPDPMDALLDAMERSVTTVPADMRDPLDRLEHAIVHDTVPYPVVETPSIDPVNQILDMLEKETESTMVPPLYHPEPVASSITREYTPSIPGNGPPLPNEHYDQPAHTNINIPFMVHRTGGKTNATEVRTEEGIPRMVVWCPKDEEWIHELTCRECEYQTEDEDGMDACAYLSNDDEHFCNYKRCKIMRIIEE